MQEVKVSQREDKLANLLTVFNLGIYRFYAVPQGYSRVVTVFGKFDSVSSPGLSKCLWFWGFYKNPGSLIPAMEQVRNYEGETVFTKDGVKCDIDTVVFFRINDVLKAVYEVENYEMAIKSLVQAILRNECGNFNTSQLLASRKELAKNLRDQLDVDTMPWGISIRLVEIKGITIFNKSFDGGY